MTCSLAPLCQTGQETVWWPVSPSALLLAPAKPRTGDERDLCTGTCSRRSFPGPGTPQPWEREAGECRVGAHPLPPSAPLRSLNSEAAACEGPSPRS